MANDKDMGIGIPVEAYAVAGSAKKAIGDVVNEANDALKKRYIEVSPEARLSLDKSKFSKEFIKAHEDLFARLDKASAKGFSLSEKELNALLKKYQRFISIANKEDKGSLPQVEKIKNIVGKSLEPFKEFQNEYRRIAAMADKEATKIEKRMNSNTTKKFKLNKDKSVDAVLRRLDYPTDTSFNRKGLALPETARKSEYSGHRNPWMQDLAHDMPGIKKAEKLSLKQWKDFKYTPAKGGGRQTTETEENKFQADHSLNILKGLFRDIEKGVKDVNADKVIDRLGISLALLEKTGADLATSMKRVIGSIESLYSANTNKRVGGVDSSPIGPGHEQAIEMEKLVKDVLKSVWDNTAPEDRQRELSDAMNEATTELKQLNKKKKTTSNVEIATANARNSPMYASLQKALGNVDNTAVRILTQNKVEGASERVADDKEVKASRKIIDVVNSDADTGFNTDQKADTLISRQEKTNKILGSETQQKLSEIISRMGVKPELDTEGNANNSSSSLLQIISDNVQAIKDKLLSKRTKARKSTSENITQADSETAGTSDVILGKFSSNVPAIVEKSLVKVLNSLVPVSALPIPVKGTEKRMDTVDIKGANKFEQESIQKNLDREAEKRREEQLYELAAEKNSTKGQPRVPKVIQLTELADVAEEIEKTFPEKLKDIFSNMGNKLGEALGKPTKEFVNADQIMQMSEDERAKETANRLNKYGKTRGRDLSDTGAKAQYRYSQSLWSGDKRVSKNSNLFQDIQLTEGIGKIDTNAIASELQQAIEKNMFNAQTGGGFRNVLGAMTGYIGMPSLEKSRAQVDGLNQVLADVREQVLNILNDLVGKESTLRAMEQQGDVAFNSEGKIVKGTPEAQNLFTDMENQKDTLRSALAEVQNIDAVVAHCKGDVGKIIANLGFVMPELRKQNTIIQNINAGLDKTGKALKFQTRSAETLNYAFQLMARSVGQMWKNWLMMLNPLNGIKKLFADFASYDVKWQRTMNVIKYNLRRIVRPMMEWIAQQFVNIIGLANALIKGIGRAFGKDWDLFDQSAANAEKMREELEEAANVSASFDELHDIGGETGSGNDAAMDLMGDIYKPEWNDLYKVLEDIGAAIGRIIDAVSNWTFWDWLKLVGAALAGYLALKWLISIFSGKKNPLEAVANGFSFLEKAVGWALLIWAFTEFTKALTDFVECMKTADWEDIAKSLVMLGGAFLELVAAITGIMAVTKLLALDWTALLGIAAIVWVFSAFVDALVPFIECIKNIEDGKYLETLMEVFAALVASFVALIAGVAGVEGVTKWIGLMGGELLGLAAVVGALDLFVVALVPFIEAISGLEGNKWDTIGPMILTLVGAFVALASGVAVVSKAFTAMDWKAIGQLYAVAGVFEVFMVALGLFVTAIKDLDFETLGGGALLITTTFISLAGAIAILAPALKMLDWSSLIQGLALMAAMAGIIWVLKEFILALQDLSAEQLGAGLLVLAGGLAAITASLSALAIVFTALVTTGIGAAAIALLALVMATLALIIYAIADFVRALGEAGAGIKLILDGIVAAINATTEQIVSVINAIAEGIATIVTSIAEGIVAIMTPILEFIDGVVEKIIGLATIIAQEIGETIRTVIETTGNVIIEIVKTLIGAVPMLLNAVLDFINRLGPSIDNFATSLMKTITKVINFMVSGIEYMINLVVSGINAIISAVNSISKYVGITIPRVPKASIPRFVPQYEVGTNYVPNDGLAYLHQGEAVIPKKYNQPYVPPTNANEQAYMEKMMSTMKALDNTMKQGIRVNGQFTQRGSDLVAVVNKVNSQTGSNLISDMSYAR